MEDRKCVFSLWLAAVCLPDRSLRGCWQGPSCNFFHLSSNGREDSTVQNNPTAPQAFHGHVKRGEYYVTGLSKTGQVLVNKAGPITNPPRQGKRGFTSVWCHPCHPSSWKVTGRSCAFLPLTGPESSAGPSLTGTWASSSLRQRLAHRSIQGCVWNELN